MTRIILASKSPGRAAVMRQLGLEFEVADSNYEEKSVHLNPHELVKEHAIGKGRAVAQKYAKQDVIVISADTIAVFENEKLGKPNGVQGAVEMLRKLSGKTHLMLTALFVIDTKTGEEILETDETRVRFRHLSEQEIQDYVATGEPLGKAGAYAIQGKGGALVEKVEGDKGNIQGLPIRKLTAVLKKLNYPLPSC